MSFYFEREDANDEAKNAPVGTPTTRSITWTFKFRDESIPFHDTSFAHLLSQTVAA